MKKEDLFEAIQEIDENKVKAAGDYHAAKNSRLRRWIAIAACAAIVVGSFAGIRSLTGIGSGGSQSGSGLSPQTYPSGIVAMKAVYPDPVAANMTASAFMQGDAHWEWWNAYRQSLDGSAALQDGMSPYYQTVIEKLLISENENTVCSPLNTYIAFAMLAEVSDGNTRGQILDMLGVKDIKTLRNQIKTLWECNYIDTPVLKSLLANSIWLRQGMTYQQETLSTLAQNYYASSFSGEPGSEAMNEALSSWTDENTGGLLGEYTKDMKLDTDTVLALVSTIYYKAMWQQEFMERETTPETFHGTDGDTTVDMMHRTETMSVFSTDTFTSVGLGLMDSGTMYFFLPKEGVSVNDLAADPDLIRAVSHAAEEEMSFPLVHMSVPKFSVSANKDLMETLRELGVTDAMDPELSDFTPLTRDADSIFLSTARHAALVEIDEQGVTGAAYTELALAGGAALPEDEINFVLDRPFLFLITARDGSLLFAGAVRNIR